MGSVTGAKPAKVLSPVLCVDLDGTLIRGNVLWECVLVLLKTRPIALLLLPFWLLAGRASLKRHLAARTCLNPARLPYRQQVLELIHRERVAGRRIAEGEENLIVRDVSRSSDSSRRGEGSHPGVRGNVAR